jgi:hypothetical protein
MLSHLGIKHVLVEVKPPGALAWSRNVVDAALVQACSYARRQR